MPAATANDAGRDAGGPSAADGYAALVTGATLQAELTHLSPGVFACAGAAGDVVEERPGRFGMLPVFLHCRQLSWVELETGAELHARLLLARSEISPATVLERIAARERRVHDHHPEVVAAYPHGASWPPGPDLHALRRRSRRVRRWASGAIAVAGIADLLSAVTPPLRSRLHLVLEVLPLGATQAAGAVVALAGIGLLALARGVRRGQHRAWAISSVVLALTLVLHLVRGGDVGRIVAGRRRAGPAPRFPGRIPGRLGPAVAALGRHRPGGRASWGSPCSPAWWSKLTLRFDLHQRLSPVACGQAVVERLVGITNIALPDRLDDFLAPSLLTVGIGLASVAVLLATRPVVDRRRTGGRAAQARARDIVRRHGEGTLDYFALRSDKQWFFHRDSLVAYAIYGGICLVSPDTIGPTAEREQVWGAFRRFADNRGWIVAVMGGAEDWLPVYRASGMHEIYIGDEAVVDVQGFSLAGGHMKGLRQAHNRIAKYGYTVTFHDPARLDRVTAERLTGLMSQSRRGEFERGFSMVLGRIFDPRDEGLILCVVTGPNGEPAALCQFVPARGIGGFSLDLMRRDTGEHPNGLIDFALVSTIEHLRQLGHQGLSLNFAALRSVLDGERGDGVTQRVERWALKRMSSFLQIETLWRFNAKYEPEWLPRYVVYDTAEHLVPVVLAILRAESLSEVPVIGRMIAASDRRAHAGLDGAGAAASTEADTGASLLPGPDHCVEPPLDPDAERLRETALGAPGGRPAPLGRPGPVEVRPATGADALAIATIHVRSWQAAYRGLLPQSYLDGLDPRESRERWEDILAATRWPSTGTLVLVDADSDAEVVTGFANIGPTRDEDDDHLTVGELRTLYLDPGIWRRGGGSLLLWAAQVQLGRAGFTRASAWVLETNARARTFYEHHHWRFDGTSKPHDWGTFTVTDVRYRVSLT